MCCPAAAYDPQALPRGVQGDREGAAASAPRRFPPGSPAGSAPAPAPTRLHATRHQASSSCGEVHVVLLTAAYSAKSQAGGLPPYKRSGRISDPVSSSEAIPCTNSTVCTQARVHLKYPRIYMSEALSDCPSPAPHLNSCTGHPRVGSSYNASHSLYCSTCNQEQDQERLRRRQRLRRGSQLLVAVPRGAAPEEGALHAAPAGPHLQRPAGAWRPVCVCVVLKSNKPPPWAWPQARRLQATSVFSVGASEFFSGVWTYGSCQSKALRSGCNRD